MQYNTILNKTMQHNTIHHPPVTPRHTDTRIDALSFPIDLRILNPFLFFTAHGDGKGNQLRGKVKSERVRACVRDTCVLLLIKAWLEHEQWIYISVFFLFAFPLSHPFTSHHISSRPVLSRHVTSRHVTYTTVAHA